ncbi:MAG: hypothetical protein ACO377_05590 [Pseudomonadales bacterium]
MKSLGRRQLIRSALVVLVLMVVGQTGKTIAASGDVTYPSDQVVYEGDHVAGIPEGKGIQRWSDGRRYEGNFRSGARDGLGILTLRDGTRFQGQFRNDRMEGFIVRESPEGMREVQEWQAGELIKAWALKETPDCRLSLDKVLWMFVGGRCMDGLAHGNGLAARIDGREIIPDGRFVVGRLVSGRRIRLVDDGR